KGRHKGEKLLDGRVVSAITAFLFHAGSHDDPARLIENADKAFEGAVVVGTGFTFDDSDSTGIASTVSEMHRLIDGAALNSEVVFPYIGGDEVNSSPTHASHRYVINFGERGEEECREKWPELIAIVEERVRSEREGSLARSQSADKKRRARYWWRFARNATELNSAIAGRERVLVCPGGSAATKYLSFAFLRVGYVFSQTLCVFALSSNQDFCVLQSRVHEAWGRFFGATLGDGLRYSSSDVFETFPRPNDSKRNRHLDSAGKEYYEFRADLMVRNDEGLTKTYNRFHDPNERNPEILKLRDLHAEMDRAVLAAYGWSDVPTDCEFFLDYEIDEEEWGEKKKPWRYRWPDDVRDEVLARLLALNQERADAEARSGVSSSRRRSRSMGAPLLEESLFE
ncbi:MAG TPA: type IIL restriction-modification enzyme MmeI, partial [Candidatus Paceibacterota bacterium]|nr:type IIL restriction-modification enzyme MmeI [Candidatus Paceibacterota bacterium]